MADHPRAAAAPTPIIAATEDHPAIYREGHRLTASPKAAAAPLRESRAGEPTTHELKVWLQYFAALESGVKTFEFRKDDRTPRFAVGDTLRLRETRPMDISEIPGWALNDGCTEGEAYTGRECTRVVTYVARGRLIPDGYCVMSLTDSRAAATPRTPILCDGCNVREPFEHRCHGYSAPRIQVAGEWVNASCECEDCTAPAPRTEGT